MPALRYEVANFALACYNDEKVYLTGGDSHNGGAHKSVFIYDVQQQMWSPGPYLKKARYYHASLCMNGSIYVAGGSNHFTRDHSIKTIEALKVGVD